MFESYDNKVKEMSLSDGTNATSGDSVELSYKELECIQGGLLKPKGLSLHVEIPKISSSISSPCSSVVSNATPPSVSNSLLYLSSDSSISRSSSLRTPSTPGGSLGLSPSSSSSSLVSTAQSGRPTKRRRIE